MNERQTLRWLVGTWLVCWGLATWPAVAAACPFCSAVSMTLGEELKAADAAVLAKIVKAPEQAAAGEGDAVAAPSLDATPTVFQVTAVLKGEDLLGERREVEVVYFGEVNREATFLILGADPAQLAWGTPVLLPGDAVEYVRALPGLPDSGADRLAFFQDYFDSPSDLMARDAHDEFAKAPYAEVKSLRERMRHDVLLEWVQNREIPASRRRLYLTMLGICGGPDDVPVLEGMIRSGEPQVKTTLDALIACYLTLGGPERLPLVEELFFKRKECDFTDTYSAIVALRFHGQEEQVISKTRLVEAFRLMLDRPQYADLVIPDLARWEDWASMERLVQLFKDADEQTSWIRVPVIQFLRQCPRPEAQTALAELAQIDPDAVKRASSFLPAVTGTAPVPPAASTPADSAAVNSTGTNAAAGSAPAASTQATSTAAEATPTAVVPAAVPAGDTAGGATEATATTAATDGAAAAGSATQAAATETSTTETSTSVATGAPAAAPVTAPKPGGNDRTANAPTTPMLWLGFAAAGIVVLGVIWMLLSGQRAPRAQGR